MFNLRFRGKFLQVLNSDSEESLPEDDPDSVVVEYVDFIKVQPFFNSSTLKELEN